MAYSANFQPFPLDIIYMREDLVGGCLLQPFHDDDVECGRRDRGSSSCCKRQHEADSSDDESPGTQSRGGNSKTDFPSKKFHSAVENDRRAEEFPFLDTDVQSNDEKLLPSKYDVGDGTEPCCDNSQAVQLHSLHGTGDIQGCADSLFMGEDFQSDEEHILDEGTGLDDGERSDSLLFCEENFETAILPEGEVSPRRVREFPFMAEDFPSDDDDDFLGKGTFVETHLEGIQEKGEGVPGLDEGTCFEDVARPGATAVHEDGEGTLTVEQLQQHDGLMNEVDEGALDKFSVAGTQTNFSADTDWTFASIMTMNKLVNKWNPALPLHKEMLAMYNATTEVIKANGGQQTDTEYFAVLMTTLEAVDTDVSRTSAAVLLALFANRVPATVLQKKFSWITTLCINFMQAYQHPLHVMLLRSLICLMACCLKSLELAAWSESSTLQVFSHLFPYIVHVKPKLRKLAQKAVCHVLAGSYAMTATGAPPTHPAVPALVAFCLPVIRSSSATALPVTTLHMFGFFKSTLHLFPQSEVKSTCEAMLEVMGGGHPTVVRCGLLTLQSFFSSQPRDVTLSAELNAQLINALYDYKPGQRDYKVYDVWLGTMQEALTNLHRSSHELFLSNLPKFVGVLVDSWQNGKPELYYSISSVLMVLLQKCFQNCLEKEADPTSKSSLCYTAGVKVIEHMQRALHYQFLPAWDQVLFAWATCFEVLGKRCADHIKEPLSQIAELHGSQTYANDAIVDRAVAAAIRALGPELVLKAVPLDMSGEESCLDFKRSWMLPILRDNIKATRLSFFITYFLPLASAFHELAEASDKPTSITKTYELLEKQIWTLLPGFCNRPTDFRESFPRIAKTLGTYLVNRPYLRLDIMSALRHLVSCDFLNDANVPEMTKYSKNFMPILFNIYTSEATSSDAEGVRLAAYDTIKIFVRIADDKLCCALFFSASARLLSGEISTHAKHAVLDLARSLVSKMGPENVLRLYLIGKVNLEDSDRRVQKKAYRVLEEICRIPTPICKAFVEEHLRELSEVLVESLQSITPGSRAPRLRCLLLLIGNLSVEHKPFALTALREAVLCIKVNAAKVRQAAYEVVIGVGKAVIRWQPEEPGVAVKELVSQLTAGFTGGSYLVSCTILALSTVLYEFKGTYNSDVLNGVMEAVQIVISSPNREIVQAALYFVRMLFVILSTQELSEHLQTLVPNLFCMSEDCRKHFRLKLRDILAKFIRKFGFENIVGLVPESYRKLAVRIRKLERRKKQKKRAREPQDIEEDDVVKTGVEGIEQILESSSEDEDEGGEKTQGSRKNKVAAAAWIEEQGEDDIVDFLDTSAGKQILSTDPKAVPKSKGKCPFEITKDGRLLIVDPKLAKAQKKDVPASDTEEAADDLLEALSHYKTKKRKVPSDVDYGGETSGTGSGAAPSKKKKTHEASDGDARKGKLEPYAYVPLSRASLNKRSEAPWL